MSGTQNDAVIQYLISLNVSKDIKENYVKFDSCPGCL